MQPSIQWHIRCMAIVLATLVVAGCATTAQHHAPTDDDPWERTNRSVYAFNKQVDRTVLRPLAVAYTEITPELAQQGISNFFTNLQSPWVASQLWLQGRFRHGSEQWGRFLINSVYGVGGLFDVADQNQLPDHDTDFGVTLAEWGWRDSRFIILPLLGPATIRDGVGQVTQMVFDPVDKELRHRAGPGITALEVIEIRSSLLGLDATLAAAYDEYAFVRDAWLQRRAFEIHGEDANLPDYDAFLEEDDDAPAP